MAITEKSKIIKFNGDKLPQELKTIPHWVAWKVDEKRNDKNELTYVKVPYNVNTDRNASTADPKTWVSYEDALKTINQSEIYEGLGFVITQSDNIVFLDIDGCIEDGKFVDSEGAMLAQTLLGTTYCEYSPSGTGVHAYFKGFKSDDFANRIDSLGMELYYDKRYMTVTGSIIEGSVDTICDNQSIIDKIANKYFHKENNEFELNLKLGEGNDLSIEKIIELCKKNTKYDENHKMTKGEKFKILFEGDWENITKLDNDHSRADLSLVNTLAFWTNRDMEKMDAIFRKSNLMRDKWDRKDGKGTYGTRTMKKAIESCQEGYKGKKSFKHMSGSELKEHLELKGDSVRNKMIEDWEQNGKKGLKPTVINTLTCAKILNDFCVFVMLNDQDNTPLSVYKADEGIYTNSSLYIDRLVGWLEPQHNEFKTNEVKYYLKRNARVQDKTNEPFLIPVNNGIYNKKTGELEEFTPDYVFTTKISTNFNSNVNSPVINGWEFNEWLSSIACNDEEIIKLLWQVIADSLNGNHTRGKAIFFTGSGSNGKGTFQDLIQNLIGRKNIAALKIKDFDDKHAMSELVGVTCVIGDDNAPGDYVDDSSNFKSVITGDIVRVEEKYVKAYNDSFKCTVIQSTNGLPRFKDTTGALYERLLIVPFDASFKGVTKNRDIKNKYIADKRVLEYILYHALQLDFEDFINPSKSIDALHEYKIDNDPIYEFKNEVFDDFEALKIPKAMVYAFYCDFCQKKRL
jgi:putative DNA primase/helicase